MAFYLYTDGATSNNGYAGARGGWAAALYEDNSTKPVCSCSGGVKNPTNNRCEMAAVLEGLNMYFNWITHTEAEDSLPLTIITDSAYIHNCYSQKWYVKWQQNGWVNSKKEPVANKTLWEQLIPYFNNPNFKFEKTKGHADDARNNYVDKLAAAAKENKWLES